MLEVLGGDHDPVLGQGATRDRGFVERSLDLADQLLVEAVQASRTHGAARRVVEQHPSAIE